MSKIHELFIANIATYILLAKTLSRIFSYWLTYQQVHMLHTQPNGCLQVICCCSVSHPVVSDSVISRTAARQGFLSLTVSWTLPKFMFTASVMPSSHLILWHPLLLLPLIFPSIRDFSSESSVPIRWPKYWSFSISPSSVFSGLYLSGSKEELS